MTFEAVFSMDASSIKFGKGATREAGADMKNSEPRAGHGGGPTRCSSNRKRSPSLSTP